MSFWSAGWARLDDALNPVMVKELRQAVRSRFVAGLLFLFLFAQLAIVALVLAQKGQWDMRPNLGRELFAALHGAILFVCMIGLPVYTAARLFAERGSEGLDLLYGTALSPRAIVRGKVGAALVLALLLYSASLPFVTFTYLLRGIRLGDIFVSLGVGFLGVMTGVVFALAAAALGGGRLQRVLVGLVAFGTLLMGYGTLQILLLVMEDSGGLRSEREVLGLLLAFGVVFLGWMYCVAVAMLSPPSAERARTARTYGLGMLLLSAGVVVLVSGVNQTEWWEAWVWGWALVAGLGFAVATSGPERPSARVARGIPPSRPLRMLAFLFTSGAAGGMLWAGFLGLLALAGGATVVFLQGSGSSSLERALGNATAFLSYALAYALTAVFLRRTVLRRRLRPHQTWIVLLVLLAIGGLVIPLLGMVLAPLVMGGESGWWLITSPLALSDHAIDDLAPLVATGWALVMVVLHGRWSLRQWRAFQPTPGAEGEGA